MEALEFVFGSFTRWAGVTVWLLILYAMVCEFTPFRGMFQRIYK